MARVKCPRCFTVNPDGQDTCIQCNAPLPRIRIEARPSPPPVSLDLQLKPGQVISNRYSIINLIGRGGMGCIYKVYDNTLGEEVALKTLLPQFLRDKLVVERFFNEARIARRMAHPNVVRVHDIGTAGNFVYISMEYLQGRSLRQLLEGLPTGQRMPLRQVLQIFDGLCAALDYAHQFTVHRDIKPENVMVLPDGTVKLMDFGISKLMADVRMTGASIVMGTPFYMSPEQLRNSRDVDARSDIYSVGVMLYEILTGNVPTGVAKPASQISTDIPAELDKIVAKCVDTDPANRYQNAAELREALRPLRELAETGKTLSPTPSPSREPGGRWLGISAAALIIAGVAGALYYLERQEVQPASESLDTSAAPSPPNLSLKRQVEPFIEALRSAAESLARQEPYISILRQGNDYWQLAEQQAQAGGGPEMDQRAQDAIQHYAAVLLSAQANGMEFIPPGLLATEAGAERVPAFYIDRREVTAGEFAKFASGEAWGRVPALVSADLPMTNVAYLDAAAYAAHLGKRLPTHVQWLKTAAGNAESVPSFPWGTDPKEAGCNCNTGASLMPACAFPDDMCSRSVCDMTGNAAEWTRSPVDDLSGGDHVPYFGDVLIVAGGSFALYDMLGGPAQVASLSTIRRMRYHEAAEDVGFRCVLEIPHTAAGVRALLDRIGS